jgi:hypothetical protein
MQNFKEIYELANKYNLVTTVNNEDELSVFFSSEEPEGDFSGLKSEIQSSAEERLDEFLEALKVALTD